MQAGFTENITAIKPLPTEVVDIEELKGFDAELRTKVLGEVLASQAGVHECWGGVVPKLAQEAHKAAIDATVEEAFRRAAIRPEDLTAVAVTVGPGLSLCLEVGVRKDCAILGASYHAQRVDIHSL